MDTKAHEEAGHLLYLLEQKISQIKPEKPKAQCALDSAMAACELVMVWLRTIEKREKQV